jgi:hypothetical protein
MRVLEGAAEGSARSMADGCVIECLRADGSAFFAEASISLADDDEGPLYTMILREVRQEGASP